MSLVKKPRKAIGFAPYPLAGLGSVSAAQQAAQDAAHRQQLTLVRTPNVSLPGMTSAAKEAAEGATQRPNYLLTGNTLLGLQFSPPIESGGGFMAKAGSGAAEQAAKAGAVATSVPPADREAFLRWYGNVTGVPQRVDAGGGVTTTASKLKWFGEARKRAARLIDGGSKAVATVVSADPLSPALFFLAWQKADAHGLAAYDSLVTPNGPSRKAVKGNMAGGPGVGGWPIYGPKRLVEYWFAAIAEERKLVTSRVQAAANVTARGFPKELLGYGSVEQNLFVVPILQIDPDAFAPPAPPAWSVPGWVLLVGAAGAAGLLYYLLTKRAE